MPFLLYYNTFIPKTQKFLLRLQEKTCICYFAECIFLLFLHLQTVAHYRQSAAIHRHNLPFRTKNSVLTGVGAVSLADLQL